MAYKIYYTRQALGDWDTLKRQGRPSLVARAQRLLEQIRSNPFVPYPPYKKLNGELTGLYARRLNIQHRLVYQVTEDIKAIKVVSMWTHYHD
jgi:Txe/YoeB family toxin of toxin-antitoxin system